MSITSRSMKWLYNEFGIASVYNTGRDAWFIIFARTCRMFAFGAISLIIALFMSSLDFSDFQIGLFMTLTLVGDVVLSLLLALVADSVGRRRVLFIGGALMVLSGAVFSYFENYWILLLAAVVGVISATGGDFGPFRSVEESTLSHLTTSLTRADVLSWYVTTSTLGSAVGTEFSGKVVNLLKKRQGTSNTQAYHLMFWIYIIMGALSMAFSFLISQRSEITAVPEKADNPRSAGMEPLLEEEEDSSEYESINESTRRVTPLEDNRHGSNPPPSGSWWRNLLSLNRFARISPDSRPVVVKLWILLTIDSLADGMVSYALTNYYLARKFELSESYLGDIMSASYLLMAISTIFAGPLARHLGLVNTMVFTHLPSSAAVLLFPIPQSVGLTIALLFIRTGLNNMDQAPRAALIAAVVKPEERTAVMGITSTLRTLASTVGPSFTGFLAGTDRFWIAFVVAGVLRIGYDLGLFFMFIGINLHASEQMDGQEPLESDEEANHGRVENDSIR
ncbi:putative membrane protein [Cladobotryum mycophilum]|uniref:Membrane protein n=1 Tax=Cladobotryum mycophilum TaxID=491253 RepID=A0ABR0SSJ0_9HYPO